MAQIDLRHADIYIKDGTSKSGAINQPGGYSAGATTIAVAGFTDAVTNGETFTISGDTTTYTISSSVGGATPTSFTFTPGLAQTVAHGAAISVSLTGGLVNNVGGYPTTTTSITIDGLAEAIPNGSTVTFGADATVYTISSSTGGSTPTALTITPGLAVAVTDDEAFTIFLAGTVNHAGATPPKNGDTSITVSGFSAAIPNGTDFTIAGSTGEYTVVSTTGGSTPTAITFTPALSTAAGIPTGSATVSIGPNILKVKIGEGNLTYEEKRNMTYVREKRSIVNGFVMTGDDEPVDVSIDLIWEFLAGDSSNGDPPTIEEALNQKGLASNWITSGADPCEPYCVDVEVVYTPPCADVKGERVLLEEYRWESLNHDLKAGTMSTKGKCKILLSTNTREVQPLSP